jgi:hypothetical protein
MTRKVTIDVAVPTLDELSKEMTVDISADKLPKHWQEQVNQITALASGKAGHPESQIIAFVLGYDKAVRANSAAENPDVAEAVAAQMVIQTTKTSDDL